MAVRGLMGVERTSGSPVQREVAPVADSVVVSPYIKSGPLTLTLHVTTEIPSGFGRRRQDLLPLCSLVAIQG